MTAEPAASAPTAPLTGIRVVDLTRVFSGPFAAQILGDLGADVMKVERLDGGDESRTYGAAAGSEYAAPFLAMNRNKRSIALDIRAEEGQAVLHRMIRASDVIIDNFRPGVMQRLGYGYDAVKELNPRIISCSISGFGASGPLSRRAANDLSIQAFTGLLTMTGESGSDVPIRTPVAIADLSAGLYAALAVLSALFERERTGRGQQVELSMLGSLASLLSYFYIDYWQNGVVPKKMGSSNSMGMPNQAFRTRDGWVCISASNDGVFQRMCAALDIAAVAFDARFALLAGRYEHREELVSIVEERTRALSSSELLTRMDEAGVSCSPVNSLDQAAQSDVLGMAGSVSAVEVHGVRTPLFGSPINFVGSATNIRHNPPRLGEQTGEILEELGYSADEISTLKEKGIVAA